MQAKDLLVSNLNISEDEYNYKGLFNLSLEEKSLQMDLANIDAASELEKIKEFFALDESIDLIRKIIMDQVMEKSAISSKITQGENYEEKVKRTKFERIVGSADMA